MPRNELVQLAAQVLRAQDEGVALAPFSSSGPALSISEAYEVSWLVHQRRLAAGWRPVGRKIGFTNRDMWTLFGVDQPVWSFVYDTTCQQVDGPATVALGPLFQSRIEPEIAVCLRRVPRVGADAGEVLDCIEWIAHSIEMVQCHYPDWKFQSTDAICDASFHGRLLLGPRRHVPPGDRGLESMLRDCAVSLFQDDRLVEVGYGRNVLGSPLAAVASLVEAIEREGGNHPLAPGEIITTGTMTKAYPVKAGERWRTAFGGDEFAGVVVEFAG